MHRLGFVLHAFTLLELVSTGAVDQYNLFSQRHCQGLIERSGSSEDANPDTSCHVFHRKKDILSAQITYEGAGPMLFYNDVECKHLVGESYFPQDNNGGNPICVSVKPPAENPMNHTIRAFRLSDCIYNAPGEYGGVKCGPAPTSSTA